MSRRRSAAADANVQEDVPNKIWRANPPGPEQKELNRMFQKGIIGSADTPGKVRLRNQMFMAFPPKTFALHFRTTKAKYGLNGNRFDLLLWLSLAVIYGTQLFSCRCRHWHSRVGWNGRRAKSRTRKFVEITSHFCRDAYWSHQLSVYCVDLQRPLRAEGNCLCCCPDYHWMPWHKICCCWWWNATIRRVCVAFSIVECCWTIPRRGRRRWGCDRNESSDGLFVSQSVGRAWLKRQVKTERIVGYTFTDTNSARVGYL